MKYRMLIFGSLNAFKNTSAITCYSFIAQNSTLMLRITIKRSYVVLHRRISCMATENNTFILYSHNNRLHINMQYL